MQDMSSLTWSFRWYDLYWTPFDYR